MQNKIINLIKNIAPLNRYNLSPDFDLALDSIKETYPELIIHKYKSGLQVWDWEIPLKWNLNSASVECDGRKILSNLDSPLRVWSGSWPTQMNLSYSEFCQHVMFSEHSPDLIPWNYKYYGHNKNFFGFSLTKDEFNSLDSAANYSINIDSSFYEDFLTMGTLHLQGEAKADNTIIISSNICHPGQVNDSLSGAACALYLYDKLKSEKNRFYSYLFTFQPEMIGTIAFLANNPELISKLNYGIFSEMLGHKGKITLQHSLSKNTRIDAVALNVLLDMCGNEFEVKDFLYEGILNDELILNHVGINIPSIAINRGTFPEYHTSGDNFEIVDFNLINEAAEIIFQIIKEMEKGRYQVTHFERVPPRVRAANKYNEKNNFRESDYIPCALNKGPIFLSKHGLYIDWRDDPRLNTIMDKILVSINGVNACSDIAKFCGTDYQIVFDYLEKFYEKGLIKKKRLC